VLNYEKKKELWKMGSVSLSELERWELESKQKKTNLDNAERDRDSLLSGLRLAPSDELSFEEKLKIWKKSNTELEKAEVNLAFTQKKIAEENLQNAKRILNDTEIRSPESGKISKINIETGELIHNQSISLIDIFYGKNIFVVFAISDMDLDKVSKGQSILFSLAGRQDKQIAGSIRFISPFLDQKTHSILVKSILDSKNENLLPGMYGIVSTELKSSTEKLFVPLNLVRGNEESGYFVYLKEGTRKRKQYVRLKIREEEAEIVSGINPNDEIVLLNSESFN
jgi:RND family efflux transporter MFP subunit